MSRCRAILIDLDGVIRRWPANDHALEQRFGLPPDAIRAEAFSRHRLRPAIRGTVSDDEWRRGVADALRERHPGADAIGAVTAWSAGIGTVDARVLELLEACAPVSGRVLLTNATSRLNDDLAAHGLSTRFGAVVNSSEVGAVKPEPAIFEAAIRACGREADEIVYVDDDRGNVASGCAMGLRGHRYENEASLRAFLTRSGM